MSGGCSAPASGLWEAEFTYLAYDAAPLPTDSHTRAGSRVGAVSTNEGRGLALGAVLWDMDGTLIDSEPYWLKAEAEMAAEHGGSWDPALGHELIGQPLSESARILRERAGIKGTTEEIIDALLERVTREIADAGIPWRPGAAELLHELVAKDVPCALVTMSYTQLAQVLIDALPRGTFSTVITGDAVANGKPHPEPYLTAMANLDLNPADCLAIEDSVPGVNSAMDSGACTVGVPAMVELPSDPRLVVLDTLAGVSAGDLNQIWADFNQ